MVVLAVELFAAGAEFLVVLFLTRLLVLRLLCSAFLLLVAGF
jgi:hypothetical protein